MLRTLALTFAVLLPSLAVANVSSMPPPPRGTWVVDETHTLSDTQGAQLNALAQALHDEGSGQLAVVVVDRAGGDPRQVALELFNRWGIGSEEHNDGALLFVALGDRAAETILGDGVDGSAEQRESDNLMRQRIVPAFKAGRPQDAIVAGTNGLATLLRGAARRRQDAVFAQQKQAQLAQALAAFEHASTSRVVDPHGVLTPEELAIFEASRPDVPDFLLVVHPPLEGFTSQDVAGFLFQKWGLRQGGWLITLSRERRDAGMIAPMALLDQEADAIALWSAAARALRGGPSERQAALASAMQHLVKLDKDGRARMEREVQMGRTQLEREAQFERALDHVTPGSFFGSLGVGAVALWGAREVLRRRPRTCKVCKQKRMKLDESADDAHLDEGQLQEEKLKSIDYDIWYCETCDDALVLPWQNLFSSHKKCERCNYRTGVESSVTLVHATYDHGGKVKVTIRCAHCSHTKTYTRSTPQKTRSSSSSSGSRSSSSSSFGGGRSSGGGSSGRW